MRGMVDTSATRLGAVKHIGVSIIRGVSGLRSVGLLRSDTKRFGDGDFFLPTKRNLNFNNQGY